jgi:hypothetical protein
MVDRLKESRGVVYMFDPDREFQVGDAFAHTHSLCVQLTRLLADAPDYDGTLPHYVALCVTKFDELPVFETARRLGLLMIDEDSPHGFPYVPEDDALVLFEELCKVSASGAGHMVARTLRNFFRPERIRVFVTSAVGFHVSSRTGRFDPEDPQNLLPDADGAHQSRVRGPVWPINVMEPLLWLSEELAEYSAAAAPQAGPGPQGAPGPQAAPGSSLPAFTGQSAYPYPGPQAFPAGDRYQVTKP